MQSQKTTIYIRTDGNEEIGFGHIIRCCALASMLKNDWNFVFLSKLLNNQLQNEVKTSGAGYLEIPGTIPVDEELNWLKAKIQKPSIVILDGYQFNEQYAKFLKELSGILVQIEDYPRMNYPADVILNHAGNANPNDYLKAFYTRCYFGIDYLLLRKEFLETRVVKKKKVWNGNILLSFGGADIQNYTLKTLGDVFSMTTDINKIHIIMGQAYTHSESLKKWIAQSENGKKVVIHESLNAKEVNALMNKCPMAVTSASGSAYEYLTTGGKLFIRLTAENQRGIFEYLIQNGYAVEFKDSLSVSLNAAGDDKGTAPTFLNSKKVITNYKNLFLSLGHELTYNLVLSGPNDCRSYFHLVNEPAVRKNSLSGEVISYASHKTWYYKKNSDQNCLLLKLVNSKGKFVGQVRFDKLESNEFDIDYSIRSEFRGKGLGRIIIKKGLLYVLKKHTSVQVIAKVKPLNIPSCRVFESLGFQINHEKCTPDLRVYETLLSV